MTVVLLLIRSWERKQETDEPTNLLAQAHAHLPRSSLSKQGQRVIEKPAQLPKRPPVRRTTPSITPNPDVLIHKLKRTAKTVNAQKIQNRTRPHKGPCSGVFRKQKVEETVFPTRYERGELPCAIEHGACHNTLVLGLSVTTIGLRTLFTHFFGWDKVYGRAVQICGQTRF